MRACLLPVFRTACGLWLGEHEISCGQAYEGSMGNGSRRLRAPRNNPCHSNNFPAQSRHRGMMNAGSRAKPGMEAHIRDLLDQYEQFSPDTHLRTQPLPPQDNTDGQFCLELFVQCIRGVGHSTSLAVAFRLLDFPLVLIQQPGFGQAWTHSAQVPGRVDFQCGKSCLFRLSQDHLEALCSKIPLYGMLVDHEIKYQ